MVSVSLYSEGTLGPPYVLSIREGCVMRTLRFATMTAVVLSLWFVSPVLADPDANHGTSGLTDPILLALIGNDDLFSTADLTTLLDPPGPNGTQHYGPY